MGHGHLSMNFSGSDCMLKSHVSQQNEFMIYDIHTKVKAKTTPLRNTTQITSFVNNTKIKTLKRNTLLF